MLFSEVYCAMLKTFSENIWLVIQACEEWLKSHIWGLETIPIFMDQHFSYFGTGSWQCISSILTHGNVMMQRAADFQWGILSPVRRKCLN